MEWMEMAKIYGGWVLIGQSRVWFFAKKHVDARDRISRLGEGFATK